MLLESTGMILAIKTFYIFVFVKPNVMTGSDHARRFNGFSSLEILAEFRESQEVVIPRYPQSQEEVFERKLMAIRHQKPKSRKA